MYITSKAKPGGREFSRPVLRALIALLYLGYPAGCILRLTGGDDPTGRTMSLVGTLLILMAAAAFFAIGASSLQRIMQDKESALDEREISIRRKAHERAYTTFAALTLLGLMYMEIAGDLAANKNIAIWRPSLGDHWNAVFWAALFLSLTLPAAYEAFTRRDEDPEPE